MDICLITGSGGLIGSEAAEFFSNHFDLIVGMDNDMRAYFFLAKKPPLNGMSAGLKASSKTTNTVRVISETLNPLQAYFESTAQILSLCSTQQLSQATTGLQKSHLQILV